MKDQSEFCNILFKFKRNGFIFLALIITLILIVVATTNYMIAIKNSDSSLINIAGRQRMLSQKIVKNMLLLHNRSIEQKNRISTIDKDVINFINANRYLIKELNDYWILGEPRYQFAKKIDNIQPYIIGFKNEIDSCVHRSNNHPDLNNKNATSEPLLILDNYGNKFLKHMDILVYELEQASMIHKRKMQFVFWIVIILIIAVIILAYFIIMMPMYNNLRNAYQTLNGYSIEQLRLNSELENITKNKTQFINFLSHEIRTPLSLLMGTVEIFQDSKMAKEERELVNVFERACNHLYDVVDGVLEISAIEAGHYKYVAEAFNLVDLVKDVVAIGESGVKSKNLSFTSSIDPNINSTIIGVQKYLRQSFFNLINNSIKFTKHGTIHFSVELLSKNSDEETIKFTVTDSGIGIPADKIENIFNEFDQGDNNTTKKFGGSGVGLSVVKELIKTMNGTINVISKAGKGSSFEVIIPFEIAKNSNELLITNVNHDPSLISLNILVVDDSLDIIMLYQRFLSGVTGKLHFLNDGSEVASKIRQESFDLILLDINMGEMGGFETINKIKEHIKNEEIKNIRVCAVTAYDPNLKSKQEFLESGFQDILSKPFRKYELINFILIQQKILEDS